MRTATPAPPTTPTRATTEPDNPPGADPRPGLRVTTRIHGPHDPERILTVDLDELALRVLGAHQPVPADLDRLAAGADLVLEMVNGDSGFGSAAPGTGPADDFADRILALTDEAFEAAQDLILPEYEDQSPELTTQLRILDHRDDPDLWSSLARLFLALEPTEDPQAARELL